MNRPTAEDLCQIISNECSAAMNVQFNYSGMGFASTPRQTVYPQTIKKKLQTKAKEEKLNRSDEVKLEGDNSYQNLSPRVRHAKGQADKNKQIKQRGGDNDQHDPIIADIKQRDSPDERYVISRE